MESCGIEVIPVSSSSETGVEDTSLDIGMEVTEFPPATVKENQRKGTRNLYCSVFLLW